VDLSRQHPQDPDSMAHVQTVGAELEAISGEPDTIEVTEILIDRSDDWLPEEGVPLGRTPVSRRTTIYI